MKLYVVAASIDDAETLLRREYASGVWYENFLVFTSYTEARGACDDEYEKIYTVDIDINFSTLGRHTGRRLT